MLKEERGKPKIENSDLKSDANERMMPADTSIISPVVGDSVGHTAIYLESESGPA